MEDYAVYVGAPILAFVAYFVLPYLSSSLNKYPGPPAARFTRLWLAKTARYGVRSVTVHQEHLKHGKFVRIGPNEGKFWCSSPRRSQLTRHPDLLVSIADPAALPIVYAHGSGSTKSDFYDAFVSIFRGLFNTRDRAEHTRKRKIVAVSLTLLTALASALISSLAAHIFSQKRARVRTVSASTPTALNSILLTLFHSRRYIAESARTLLSKWDALGDKAQKDASGGKMKGYAVIELLDWLNALAFDVIGDLAFGSPFGMLDHDAADLVAITGENGEIIHAPAVKILNERGEFSATQGSLPPWVRPYTKYIDPWFARGQSSVTNLAGIARNKVNARLQAGPGDRKDILTHLQAARDENGLPLPKPELTAEALTQLIAGSDTTSNSSCAIIFFIIRNERVHKKLRAELDEAFAGRGIEGVLEYEETKGLPYLLACINEALRRHSTSGMGLPRIMTKETEVCGEVFPPGTILSVPSYTIHHLESVWGKDALEYRPERWLEDPEKTKELEKALNMSCVGRNVAFMELVIFISTFIYRYDFKLVDAERNELEVAEGFLRKPLGCQMGVKRRENVV
ncbi:benzoate 4-monooxygenase, partial [Phenoliferia sp. Uapishka_3]